jgi:hypothetical protein
MPPPRQEERMFGAEVWERVSEKYRYVVVECTYGVEEGAGLCVRSRTKREARRRLRWRECQRLR